MVLAEVKAALLLGKTALLRLLVFQQEEEALGGMGLILLPEQMAGLEHLEHLHQVAVARLVVLLLRKVQVETAEQVQLLLALLLLVE